MKTMRDAVRNKERLKRRRTQVPSTDRVRVVSQTSAVFLQVQLKKLNRGKRARDVVEGVKAQGDAALLAAKVEFDETVRTVPRAPAENSRSLCFW